MINKKGISAVVANVLIVLLVVAAVAIIWAVINPVLRGAGDDIAAASDCQLVNLKAIDCTVGYCVENPSLMDEVVCTNAGNNWSKGSVLSERGQGGPEDLYGVRISVEGKGICDKPMSFPVTASYDIDLTDCVDIIGSLEDEDKVTVNGMLDAETPCVSVGVDGFTCVAP
jgi:hypothetical protein